MKNILIMILSITYLYSAPVDVDIQAEYFDSDKAKNKVIFRGNVSMVKGADTLVCDEITLKTKMNEETNSTQIISYVAIGNVSFTIKNPTSYLIGNGDKVTYDIDGELYVIRGNGYLEDRLSNKIIRGENIYINQKTGHTRIDGTKEKPVQFKFTIEEK